MDIPKISLSRDNIPLNHPRRIAKIAYLSERELAHESEEVRRLCAEHRAAEDERYRAWKSDALNR